MNLDLRKIWFPHTREKSDFHREISDFHREKSDFHREKSDFHREKSDFHRVKSDFHREKSDFHREKSNFHRKKSDFPQKKNLISIVLLSNVSFNLIFQWINYSNTRTFLFIITNVSYFITL